MNNLNTDLLQVVDREAMKIWQEINTGHKYAIIDSYEQFYGICVQIAETILNIQGSSSASEQ